MAQLSEDGIKELMEEERSDAVVTLNAEASNIFAIDGYPAISVPAGYDNLGAPFGICFGCLKGSEPTLIEVAFAFEQATKIWMTSMIIYSTMPDKKAIIGTAMLRFGFVKWFRVSGGDEVGLKLFGYWFAGIFSHEIGSRD
ncbi:uncharacterized protein A4U43_C04F7110 [Asparagus officinalis]|uniref:Amidase domain-containing protein n=1 Tax=Asparagus officinalis TaxID=4686 RepID=A0A5P1EYX5_ASPOF|nr:uncharacterized protein A4U43_C04F7110 [Asparagus officinalis]